jgi:amidophosphoribosyltransferase
VEIGRKDGALCVCFESFSFLNLGYHFEKELGPGEITYMTPEHWETVAEPFKDMRICTFLWIYYGFPGSTYEGLNVEDVRYGCGKMLAKRDKLRGNIHPDCVAGVPDSGTAHAVGYSNESGVPFSRPFNKYTPTWPRSFMPTIQSKRDLIARMKLIPVHELIDGQRILLIDDSIVRGTQLRKTVDFLYNSGAKEVHARPASPPILFGCKYLNFSRSTSDLELIARRTINKIEGRVVESDELGDYLDPDSEKYAVMIEELRKEQGFTSLSYNRLDDMLDAVGIPPENLCTYCWNGKG